MRGILSDLAPPADEGCLIFEELHSKFLYHDGLVIETCHSGGDVWEVTLDAGGLSERQTQEDTGSIAIPSSREEEGYLWITSVSPFLTTAVSSSLENAPCLLQEYCCAELIPGAALWAGMMERS